MAKIRVDIDELMGKLDEIRSDDYVTVELDIPDDEYDNAFDRELIISAVTFEDEEPIGYGAIAEAVEELI